MGDHMGKRVREFTFTTTITVTVVEEDCDERVAEYAMTPASPLSLFEKIDEEYIKENLLRDYIREMEDHYDPDDYKFQEMKEFDADSYWQPEPGQL